MHCVGEYPTADEKMHLSQIDFLRKRYTNVRIGFSTHENPDNTDLINLPGETNDIKGTLFFDSLLGTTDNFLQTSYNGTFRKNFAGIGYTWRSDLDGFVPPMPIENPIDPETKEPIPGDWILNEQTCNWDFIPTN
jgi:hypothetical protein